MKYCENCGGKLEGGKNFCPNCGTKVNSNTVNNVTGEVINNNSVSVKDNTPTAFALSLIGALCCTYCAIPGLILSIISLRDMKAGKISSEKKWMAILGIVLSCIGILELIYNIIYPNRNQEIIDNITKNING